MTPGLANGPPFPPRAKKGAIVAVASLDNPSVPVTVGQCEIDVSALGSVQGLRGHAVQTMHWAGDEIWAYSTSAKPGVNPPDHIDGWLSENVDEEKIADQTASMTFEDKEQGGVPLDPTQSESGTRGQSAAEDDDDTSTKDEASAEVIQMTTKGLCYALEPLTKISRLTTQLHRNRRRIPQSLPIRRAPPSNN